MYTLFIDTHYIKLHIALFKSGKLCDEIIKDDGKHSEYFINSLESILNRNKIGFDDLKTIIVVNGPGSFTGVRIGVVVAKMIGYNKNIPLKVISYLQALSLKYDKDIRVGIKDKNGVFVGTFNYRHELVSDYFYLSNKEFENYKKDIIIDEDIDLNKVYQFMLNEPAINPHLVNPIYVKKIEVDKWLEKQVY